MREEGEISDEEPPQAEPSSSKPAPLQMAEGIPVQNDRPSISSVSPRLGSSPPALLARISLPQSPASNSPSTSSAPYAERPLSYPPPDLDQELTPATYHSDAPLEGRSQWQDTHDNQSYFPYQSDEQTRFNTERYEIYPGLISMFVVFLLKSNLISMIQ
jgi:hypothetical protein